MVIKIQSEKGRRQNLNRVEVGSVDPRQWAISVGLKDLLTLIHFLSKRKKTRKV